MDCNVSESTETRLYFGHRYLSPGDQVRLGRYEKQLWVVHHGWYSFAGNRPVYGWYLQEVVGKVVKPLQLTDLDDIYVVIPSPLGNTKEIYVTSIAAGATVQTVTLNSTVIASDGTECAANLYDVYGDVNLLVTRERRKGAILSKKRLSDIRFMNISNITDWDVEQKSFIVGGKSVSYYVYTSKGLLSVSDEVGHVYTLYNV